jgi:hypothetical protein
MATLGISGPVTQKVGVAPLGLPAKKAAPPPPPTIGTAAPGGTTSFADALKRYEGAFGPAPSVDTSKVDSFLRAAAAPPTVTAPTVPAASIDIPRGSYAGLERSMYESQFRPVERELTRQRGIADTQLNAALAAAGLSESGTGIGQRAAQAGEFDRRSSAAAEDAANRAATARYQAEIGIATRNAELQQQTNLLRANLDVQAQTQNAANVLKGNVAAAEVYMQALGLNAQLVSQYRSNFLQMFTAEEQSTLARDRMALEASAQAFNQYLQLESLALNRDQLAQEFSLARDQLDLQRDTLATQTAQNQATLEQNDRKLAADAAAAGLSAFANPENPRFGIRTDTRTGAPLNPAAELYQSATRTLTDAAKPRLGIN